MSGALTIIYTDDDQEDLEFFKEIVDLIDENVEVTTLRNGKALLQELEERATEPNCLFLDVNMPGMNGFETLKQLRSSEKFGHVPVVMFSTSGDQVTIDKSRELGASLFVQKSGVLDNLRKSIKHALEIDWATFRSDDKNFVYKG
ncbi:MAG: response regulator [Flavobacterium sp.]